MQLNTSIPQDWEQPKYWLGQRTQQGLIIGVEYCPPDSAAAEENGAGWSYAVLPSNGSQEIYYYSAAGLKLLSADELQQALQAELVQHQRLMAAIEEQLAAIAAPTSKTIADAVDTNCN